MRTRDLVLNGEKLWCEKTSGFLLNLSSEVLGVYPWFLRASLILYRLVQ